MIVKTVQRPALTLVGPQIRTKPMSGEIKALWPKFVERIPEIENRSEPHVTYGVIRHEEGTADTLDYMAAVPVSDPEDVPKGMKSTTLPAGTYAVFSFPFSGLQQGFHEIFENALPSSNYVQADGPYFERYGESFDPDDPESPVEVYLPVKRRTQ